MLHTYSFNFRRSFDVEKARSNIKDSILACKVSKGFLFCFNSLYDLQVHKAIFLAENVFLRLETVLEKISDSRLALMFLTFICRPE